MACSCAESGCMSGGRSMVSILREPSLELLLTQLHRPLQYDAALMDPIVIGNSQVLLMVEYLWCGQVAMLLLYYKPEALILLGFYGRFTDEFNREG